MSCLSLGHMAQGGARTSQGLRHCVPAFTPRGCQLVKTPGHTGPQYPNTPNKTRLKGEASTRQTEVGRRAGALAVADAWAWTWVAFWVSFAAEVCAVSLAG